MTEDRWKWPVPRPLPALVTGLVVLVALVGCGAPDLGPADESAPATTQPVTSQQATPATLADEVNSLKAQKSALQNSVGSQAGSRTSKPASGAQAAHGADGLADVVAGLSGRNGVAVVPVGGGKASVAGTWSSGVAWSTIKVPLGVAAVRADGRRPSSATATLLAGAITRSDNAAAEGLWKRLGGGSKAGLAVQAVIRDAGDSGTRVQTSQVRPPFTPFGQTQWTLAAQAGFAARLPCLRGAGPVLGQMGRVTASQRWGLGSLGSMARYKGGWGPASSGGYLVRQLGVISLPGGRQLGVALASEPADGSFATGQANLTRMAGLLGKRLGSFTGGRC